MPRRAIGAGVLAVLRIGADVEAEVGVEVGGAAEPTSVVTVRGDGAVETDPVNAVVVDFFEGTVGVVEMDCVVTAGATTCTVRVVGANVGTWVAGIVPASSSTSRGVDVAKLCTGVAETTLCQNTLTVHEFDCKKRNIIFKNKNEGVLDTAPTAC